MLTLLANFWLDTRVKWSNFIHRKDIKDYPVHTVVKNASELTKRAKELHKRFEYKHDSAVELLDAMHTPAQCYSNIVSGKLMDDCDGFAAAMYHLAVKNELKCYLLTYIADDWRKSHTVLLIDEEEYYSILDYDNLFSYRKKSFTLENIINRVAANYNTFVTTYNLVEFKDNRYIISK